MPIDRHMRPVALLLAVAAIATPAARQAVPDPVVVVETNLEARMRDGVVLRADVYRPVVAGRRPALLQRTPCSGGRPARRATSP